MDLRMFAEGLDGTPAFSTFLYRDLNPVSGQLKLRLLYNPNGPMRVLHSLFRGYLARVRPELDHATGGLLGCSPRENVLRHRDSRYFYTTDIVSAYNGVDLHRLAAVIVATDEGLVFDEVVDFLTKFCCTDEGGLATGSPSSPDLYNLYAGVLLDRELGAYCLAHGLVMTRYLDDITISSSAENGPIGKHKRRAIRKIVADSGFAINDAKTHVFDLALGTIVINGIGLELGGRTFLPRRYHRFLRGFMHRASHDPEISYPMVAGRMGVFWGSTGKGSRLNRTERKLVSQFEGTKNEFKQGGRY